MKELFEELLIERPTGTKNNEKIVELIENKFSEKGYEVISIPFECNVWKNGKSYLKIGGKEFSIEANPFSEYAEKSAEIVFAKTMAELKNVDADGKILILSGELTQNPPQPKDFPFYYPDEDKAFITLLEEKKPAAIIAATGKGAFCGLNPAPLFEDGNFLIPSASISADTFTEIVKTGKKSGKVLINSHKEPAKSRQIIAVKNADQNAKTVMLCAHMDSKYNTVGALDNAAGVAVLLEAAKRLAGKSYNVQVVPFNSEEYYGVNGELAYLGYAGEHAPQLVINIDSPCHIGADNAVSFYNFDTLEGAKRAALECAERMTEGEQWYSGDHSAFAFMGTPCAVIASADLFTGGLDKTHTPNDTADNVDISTALSAADFIVKLADEFCK